MDDVEKWSRLKKLYTNLEDETPLIPGSLGAKSTFRRSIKTRPEFADISKKTIDRKLSEIESYLRFRPHKWKFFRRATIARGVHDVWECDLAFFDEFRVSDKRILLVVCDVVSRYCWLRMVPKKSSSVVAQALESIFRESGAKPRIIFSDRGTEFEGDVSRLLEKNGVLHWRSNLAAPQKAAMVEAKIKQIKYMIYRYLSTPGDRRRKSVRRVLSKIQDAINLTPSRMLPHHWTPAAVEADPAIKGKAVVRHNRERREKREREEGYPKNFSFRLGDTVRIQTKIHENKFKKATTGIFSKEIFSINRRFNTIPHTYAVLDSSERPLRERLYSPEIVRIAPGYAV